MTQHTGNDHDTGDQIPEPAEERVATRAGGLTPEEQEAGSDDPEAQARAILAESEERIAEQADDPDDVERRTSDEATGPL